MPSVTPVLWTYRINKNGLSPIYIRVTDTSGTNYKSLKIYVKPGHWNKAGRVTTRHRNAEDINRTITEAVQTAEAELLRRRGTRERITTEGIKRAMEEAEPDALPCRQDFFAFADDFVAGYLERGQVWTHDRYVTVLKKLRRYTGEPFAFEDLTPALLRRYENYLMSEFGNSRNTIATNLNTLRTVVRRAIAEGRIDYGQNPFNAHKITLERTERVRLTLAEIQTIEALDLDPLSRMGLARNTFLLQFYAGGARFSDAALLRWRSVRDGQIAYIASKTKKATVLPLVAQAAAVLDVYRPDAEPDPDAFVLPLLTGYDLSTPTHKKKAIRSRTTQVNLALKKVAALAGIDKNVSTHIARHSFADHCRTSGLSVYDISQALRHSSLKQTERYLNGFDTGGLGDKLHAIFSAPDTPPPAE